jgi:hypothetical protein
VKDTAQETPALSRGIYAPIPTVAREALYELAEREWRDPREQAAKLIVEGLERAGALPRIPTPPCVLQASNDESA